MRVTPKCCEKLYYYHPMLGFNYLRDTQYTTISWDFIIIVALRRLWQYIIFLCRSGYQLCSCMKTLYHTVYNKLLKGPIIDDSVCLHFFTRNAGRMRFYSSPCSCHAWTQRVRWTSFAAKEQILRTPSLARTYPAPLMETQLQSCSTLFLARLGTTEILIVYLNSNNSAKFGTNILSAERHTARK